MPGIRSAPHRMGAKYTTTLCIRQRNDVDAKARAAARRAAPLVREHLASDFMRLNERRFAGPNRDRRMHPAQRHTRQQAIACPPCTPLRTVNTGTHRVAWRAIPLCFNGPGFATRIDVSEGLFRQQVTQARKDAWLGGALPRPRMAWPMAILAAAAMLAIVLLLAFGGYTRKERVQGRLVPHAGLIEVAATDHATSARLQVREGPLLLAEFWIPGRAIGTLAVGGDISMRYASLPHQEFGRQPG
ncbi:MAG: hypothetical protein L0H23_13735, partial [Luteimonas sp.]|nr:hypothetical protein [Luteimonas sp.]